nr:DUF4244 domain-containing protein [Clavibacter sp.]
MGRIEERTHAIDARGADAEAARGPASGMTGAAMAPEGRAVWPLAAARTAPTRSSGRATSCAGICGGEVVTASPGLVPSRSARVVRAARRALLCRAPGDAGAATAEYAIATMAAVAFAGLLVVILQSDEVRGMLLDLVRRALTYDR